MNRMVRALTVAVMASACDDGEAKLRAATARFADLQSRGVPCSAAEYDVLQLQLAQIPRRTAAGSQLETRIEDCRHASLLDAGALSQFDQKAFECERLSQRLGHSDPLRHDMSDPLRAKLVACREELAAIPRSAQDIEGYKRLDEVLSTTVTIIHNIASDAGMAGE
jgi:hypothetical protein